MLDVADEELIEQARQAQDPRAHRDLLGRLFQRYHARVALWCYRFSGSRDLAEDLTQEIFLKTYANLASFGGQAKFSTWLYAVTLNHCRDDRDKRTVRRAQLLDPLSADIPFNDPFDQRLESKQDSEVLRKLMCTSLNETEQKVLMLHYGEEIRLDEITRLLQLKNPSGAKAHVVNARRKLAAAMERWKQRTRHGSTRL